MEQHPNDKQSGRSAAIAALLAAGAGAGIGWVIWLTTGNNGVAIGMAGPIALLVNNMLRKVIK
jgi:LmbE family N-acetylglucosaminyl deacetylase